MSWLESSAVVLIRKTDFVHLLQPDTMQMVIHTNYEHVIELFKVKLRGRQNLSLQRGPSFCSRQQLHSWIFWQFQQLFGKLTAKYSVGNFRKKKNRTIFLDVAVKIFRNGSGRSVNVNGGRYRKCNYLEVSSDGPHESLRQL